MSLSAALIAPLLLLAVGVEPPPREPDDVEPPGTSEVEPTEEDSPDPTPAEDEEPEAGSEGEEGEEAEEAEDNEHDEGEADDGRDTRTAEPAPAVDSPAGDIAPTDGPEVQPSPLRTDPSNWHVSLDLQTDFPVSFSIAGTLEMPAGLYLQAGVGWLPAPYVDVVNALSTSVRAYDQETASLISATLDDSLVVRALVGWRPFEEWGLTFAAGYGLLALGGGVASTDLLAVVTGTTPPSLGGDPVMVDIDAMVHMINLEVGYQWELWDPWLVRVAIGGAFTAAAVTSLRAPWPTSQRPAALTALEHKGEGWLRDTLESYVHTATVTVAVRYRFL